MECLHIMYGSIVWGFQVKSLSKTQYVLWWHAHDEASVSDNSKKGPLATVWDFQEKATVGFLLKRTRPGGGKSG